MTLTTRDIQEKQFHDAFRGYSHEEVDEFIDQVAESFDELAREKHALTMKIEELQEQLRGARVQGPDDMLKRLLVTAQETADKAIQNARAKAQGMIEEAENRARLIREQAESLSASRMQEAERRAQETLASVTSEERDLRSRIDGMKRFEKDFRSRLTAFIRSQLELLEKTSLAQPEPISEFAPPEPREPFSRLEPREPFAPPEPKAPTAAMEHPPSWDEIAAGDPFMTNVDEKEASLEVEGDVSDFEFPPPRPSGTSEPAIAEPGSSGSEPLSDALPEERIPERDAIIEGSTRDRGAARNLPPPRSVPRTAQPTQPVSAPTPAAASESQQEPEPKDDNRSIRELFWGEE
jgi:cell division initiation protein